MRRKLLAPTFRQYLLQYFSARFFRLIAAVFGRQAHQPAAHQTVVGAGRFRTWIAALARFSPTGRRFWVAEDMVVGVEGVHVRLGWELRVQGQAKQSAVTAVVDLGSQVREHRWSWILEVVVDENPARLFGDEDTAVRGEPERRRFVQAIDRDGVLKAFGKGRRRQGRLGSEEKGRDRAEERDKP